MTTWNWNGARWWKLDLHVHTPASQDYGKGGDQALLKRSAPKDVLLGYMKNGIDCVAVTDHNTGAWVDPLKQALGELRREMPVGFRDLVLFPGVEISANGGVHVLAIFGPESTTSEVDTLLGAIRFRGTKGSSDAETEASFGDVIQAIEDARAIAIPSHADQVKGLFELQGVTLQQALDCKGIVAMEIVDAGFTKPQVYIDKGLAWTPVVGSDGHHPDGAPGQRYPGSHFTWVKMGTPGLDGLHLALLDGPLSVQRSDQVSGDPNSHAPLAIEAIEVQEAQYMGRARPFTLDLNPWLNAIIGGRGTGKSTLVEFLRMALRREAELPDALAADFQKYRKIRSSREDDGLLTEGSIFTLTYRKDRTRFRVRWSQGGALDPIQVEDENGEWRTDQGDVAQRFPVRIYSQKQIFELAKAPLALLRIVDEASDVDRRSSDDRWKEEEARFLALRARAREIEAGLADEPRLRGELEDVKRRLGIFEEAGHANVLKEYQKRLRQRREVDTWEQTWANAGERLRDLAAHLVPSPLDASLFETDRAEDQELLEKATIPMKRLEATRSKIEGLALEVDESLGGWTTDRTGSTWNQAVKAALAEYENLKQKLAAEAAGDPSVYGELVQRRQTLEGRLKDLDFRRKDLSSVQRDGEVSLNRLKTLRRDLTQRRTAFLSKILGANPYVQVEVVPYGARGMVELEFRRLIQRETGGFEKDIGAVGQDGLLAHLYAGSGAPAAVEQRLSEIKMKLLTIAAGRSAASDLRDLRFATHLAKLPPEAFDRLDMWFPEDSLQVQYSTTGDGSGFRPIQEGSPGQKTAALLAFLFSYGEEPIVLDQPEDDLDNQLIYDLIVTQIRRIKQKRQIVVVTHNPNIVVNGDAELVVALAARGGETQEDCAGSLQERKVRDTICAVMEGGRQAFEQRYRRIVLGTT